jgi:hypothetical protein
MINKLVIKLVERFFMINKLVIRLVELKIKYMYIYMYIYIYFILSSTSLITNLFIIKDVSLIPSI